MKKLKNTEVIKLLEYSIPQTNSGKTYTAGDMIIYNYESDRLVKYLGDIIVDEYTTKRPEDQSVWNSDSVRLSFI
jgi:hypothetical protein